MKKLRMVCLGLTFLLGIFIQTLVVSGADTPPYIQSLSTRSPGEVELIFYGGEGPFRIEQRTSMNDADVWINIDGASVTELRQGVYRGIIPCDCGDMSFFRIVSESEGISELKGWTIRTTVSSPANGLYFVPGERPVVTVSILDSLEPNMTPYEFSTLNLYMYGPQAPQKTVTPVKLLNASTNRAARPHHYIDLKTNPDVEIQNNNVLTYQLQPVTDEEPGTYTLSVWAVLAADRIQQFMKFADLQIGTAEVENPVVANRASDGAAKCAACHEGPLSGKTYMHHIDPSGSPGSVGNWSLDFMPVKSCKSCHNNDGYAAYRDSSAPGGRVPDPIVRRVHGVHMGAGLKLPFNIDPDTGSFRDYIHVEFPANVRNCTKCHLDDRWKTNPSRLACGTCHDNVWFGPPSETPDGMKAVHPVEIPNDNACALCHAPESSYPLPFPEDVGVAAAHYVPPTAIEDPPPLMNDIDISLSPPDNGSFYVGGEKPVVTLVFKDDSGTNAIDHTQVTDGNFSTAHLYVYGPRARAVPVLTSAAKNGNSKLRASVTNRRNGPWDINGKIFRLAINGSAPQDIMIVGANSLVNAAEVVASLNPVITNLNGGALASVSGARVNIRTLIQGEEARIEIYNGDVTTAMQWKRPPNTVLEPDVTVAASSRQSNDLRELSNPDDYSDPMVTRTAENITYQLDDVAGLSPGTYGIYAYHLPRAGRIAGLTNVTGLGQILFQVGTATPEKKVASNCSDCHGGTIWHLDPGPIHAAPFDPDYCVACHDYGHTSTGDLYKNQGGTSLNGWSGFGAMPLSKRIHGVHRGHYLEHPEEVYANATQDTFGHIIFPQDIRNCTKCHSETDTWKEKPSRMACLACHDEDAAKVHGLLMTYIPDPSDPYGPSAQESCKVCHGEGADFSADKVHRISNPYVPPYPRERAE